MKIQIEIKTKGKEIIPTSLITEIMGVMDEAGYKTESLKHYRICNCCEVKLPKRYPVDLDLCPNCEEGREVAKSESD